MAEMHLHLGVVLARGALPDLCGNHAYVPHTILPAAPAMEPGKAIASTPGAELIYAGSAELVLHSSVTANYLCNLASERPSVWVALGPSSIDRCPVPRVTADPAEGEAWTEGLDVIVEALPMPASVRAELVSFVEAFHVERAFVKRQRTPARAARQTEQARGRAR